MDQIIMPRVTLAYIPSESSRLEIIENYDWSPYEEKMAAAVIARSLRDALGDTGVSLAQNGGTGLHADVVRKAKAWLEDDSNIPFSSNWYFQVLDLDKEKIIKAVIKNNCSKQLAAIRF